MKVSVVSTTARYGSFDMLYHSMQNQTMDGEDFEVIVVDELHDRRRGLLKSCEPKFQVKHIPSPRSEFYNNSAGFNAGLRIADGELVCFMVDYMYVYPCYLEDHWNFYKSNSGWSMTGFLDRYEFPPLEFGPPDNSLYSTFKQPWTHEIAEKYFTSNEPVYQERKGSIKIVHADGRLEMPGEKIYLIPDSIPLAVLKELNGIDDAYDGYYGSNDVCVGVRANMLGWHFGLNENCIVQKLGTPILSGLIPSIKKPFRDGLDREASAERNYRFFRERIKAIADGREPLAVPQGRGAWR